MEQGGGHFGFGPLWTHLEGRRRDLSPVQICIYFPSLSSIFSVAFLMPPFHQIPSNLMFKVISFVHQSFWLGGGVGGQGVCVYVCVDGVNRLRVLQLHWKSDEGTEKARILLNTKSLDWFDRSGPLWGGKHGVGYNWGACHISDPLAEYFRVIQGSSIIGQIRWCH